MCRGLCLDSRKNVEAHLLMAEIIAIKGDTGDDLLHGVSKNGTVAGLLEYAEDGLVELSKELDIALGRPSRLTAELTDTMTAELEAHQAAQALAERYLKDSQNELSESAAALWQSRHDLAAAQAQVADLEANSAQLSAELTRVQDELARSQEALAGVLASASWKLTAPLRRMISALKRR